MEIRGTHDEFVRLIPLFVSLPKDASATLDCSCAMASHRFAGATAPDEPVVRIGQESLQRFVDAVHVLERNRRGEAILTCSELQLLLSVSGRADHIRLRAALTEHQSGGIHQVAIEFGVDPASMPGILGDLEALLAFPREDKP